MGRLVQISFACVLLCTFASLGNASRMVCYFGSWSVYRWGNGKFDVEDIDPFLCTHLMFGFVGLSDEPGIRVLDPWNELYDDYGKGALLRFTGLKKKNPALKTMVAIGGWNEGSIRYSKLLSTESNRLTFVRNALNFIKKFNFDGLDLDWEYPAQRGGGPDDVRHFTELIRALREEFDKHGLLLSAAVAAAEVSFSQSYNVNALGKYLDFINVMTYDMHGAWERTTGHNAPLYQAKDEIGTDNAGLNVNAAIKAWISYGAPLDKLVMGVGMYGRTFTLASSECSSPRCPATGGGRAGTWTSESGFMGYNEICLLESEYTLKFDEEAQVPYMTSGLQWISYDNVKSVQTKVDFIKRMKLGGAMIWSVETDDFTGYCGHGKFPLLTTLSKGVLGENTAVTDSPVIDITEGSETTEDVTADKVTEITEEVTTSEETIVTVPQEVVTPEENITIEETDIPDEVTTTKETEISGEVTAEVTGISEEGTTSEEMIVTVPEEVETPEENITTEEAYISGEVITTEEPETPEEVETSELTDAPPEEGTTIGEPESSEDVTANGSIDSIYDCTKPGYVRDVDDCQVFYSCSLLPSGMYKVVKFKCSLNLVFDTTRNVCNYPEKVQCL